MVGRQIDLDRKVFTIVGVAPQGFLSETVGESVDVWATMPLMPPDLRAAPGYTWLNLMGRLKPGVSAKQAATSLGGLPTRLQNRFIERVEIEPGSSGSPGLRDTFSAPLKVLMGVVAVALLIACANLAGSCSPGPQAGNVRSAPASPLAQAVSVSFGNSSRKA